MEKELKWLPKAIMIKLDKCHNRWEEAAFSASRADCIWAKCKRK